MKNSILTNIIIGLLSFPSIINCQTNSSIPSDECLDAPYLCLENLIVSNKNYKPSLNTFCWGGQSHNDLWIAFKPKFDGYKIIDLEILECSNYNGLQVSLYDYCGNYPIDCKLLVLDGTNLASSTIGESINFNSNQTYYLRVDGYNGAECSLRINSNPDEYVNTQDPFTTKWAAKDVIVGSKEVSCIGYEMVKYIAPIDTNAIYYNWSVTKDGQFLFDINQFDVNKNVFETNLIDNGEYQIAVEGRNGCYSTGITSIKVVKSTSKTEVRKIQLCKNENEYFDPNLSSLPFLADTNCGITKEYIIILKKQICNDTIILNITKSCDTLLCNCKGVIVGEMDTTQNKICVQNNFATFTIQAKNSTIPANYTFEYFITDNLNNSFTNILDRNQNGKFEYKNTYIYGKQYYLIYAIGEKKSNGALNIDPTNKCFKYLKQEIVFNKAAIINNNFNNKIVCGNAIKLDFNATNGNGNWVVLKSPLNAKYTFSPSESIPDATFTVSEKGTYELIWVEKNVTCNTYNPGVIIFKNSNFSYSDLKLKCNDSGLSYVISTKLNGKPPYKLVKGSNFGFIFGNVYTSFPISTAKPYKVEITDAQNCEKISLIGSYKCTSISQTDITNKLVVNKKTDIEELQKNILIYPNPANSGIVYIELDCIENSSANIYDVNGQLIMSTTLKNNEKHELDVSKLNAGIYFISASCSNNIYFEKLVLIK